VSSRPGGRRATAESITIAILMAVGLAVRVAMLRSRLGVLDSDEAVVGLMARHVLSGSFPTFFWGQHYGGSLEALLAVPLVAGGTSALRLKVLPIALYAVACLLTWRIGAVIAGERVGRWSALVLWLWPGAYVWWSIKERGFYGTCLCLGLALVLLGLTIVRRIRTRRDVPPTMWFAFGLVGGLGWWTSPQIGLFAVPLGIWMVPRLRVRRPSGRADAVGATVSAKATSATLVVAGGLLGALPWLAYNLSHGWASLATPPGMAKGSYLGHLWAFAARGLPTALGVRIAYSDRWLGGSVAGGLLYAVLLSVVGAGVAGLRRTLAISAVVAFPFLNALLPPASYVGEGRYTVFLAPWLAMALAAAALGWSRPGSRQVAVAALAGLTVAISAGGLLAMRGLTDPYAPDVRVPRSLAALEHSLEDRGLTRIYANYWLAYRITYETGERIVAAPTSDGRHPAYDRMVAAAGDARQPVAHVFLRGSRTADAFVAGLIARRVRFERWEVGPFAVYVTAVPVPPVAIAGSYS